MGSRLVPTNCTRNVKNLSYQTRLHFRNAGMVPGLTVDPA